MKRLIEQVGKGFMTVGLLGLVLLILLSNENATLRKKLTLYEVESNEVAKGLDEKILEVKNLNVKLAVLEEQVEALKLDLNLTARKEYILQEAKNETVKQNMEIEAMAQVMYSEARGEGLEGLCAVASVMRNRVKSNIYPDNYVDVALQKKQFYGIWLYDFSEIEIPELIYDIAKSVYYEDKVNLPSNVLFFKTIDCEAQWDNEIYKPIGNHVFYFGG